MTENPLERQFFHKTDILVALKTSIPIDDSQKIEICLSADETPNDRPPKISIEHRKLAQSKKRNKEEWQKVGSLFAVRLSTVSLGNVLAKMSTWFEEVKQRSGTDIQYLPHISRLIDEGIKMGLIVLFEDNNQGTYFVLPPKQPRIES